MRALVGDHPSFYRNCAALFGCDTPLATDVGGDAVLNHDLSAAKQLLRAAGYKGEPLVLLRPAGIPDLARLGDVTRLLLTRVGATVEVVETDLDHFVAKRASRAPAAQGVESLSHALERGQHRRSGNQHRPLDRLRQGRLVRLALRRGAGALAPELRHHGRGPGPDRHRPPRPGGGARAGDPCSLGRIPPPHRLPRQPRGLRRLARARLLEHRETLSDQAAVGWPMVKSLRPPLRSSPLARISGRV